MASPVYSVSITLSLSIKDGFLLQTSKVWALFRTWMSIWGRAIPSGSGRGPAIAAAHWGATQSSMVWRWQFADDIPHPNPWQNSCGWCNSASIDRRPQSLDSLIEKGVLQTPGCWRSSSYSQEESYTPSIIQNMNIELIFLHSDEEERVYLP